MANIEIANIMGSTFQHANISYIVGVGERNERSDVMLIQALFKLVGYNESNARKCFGSAVKDLPEITGNFDAKTNGTIREFQMRMSNHLLNVDGKIHPANYKNRIIKKFDGRLMAITLLNRDAVDGAIEYGGSTILALKSIAPQLLLMPAAP